jgi:hypothetical protein
MCMPACPGYVCFPMHCGQELLVLRTTGFDPNPTLPDFNCRIAKGLFVPDVGGLSDDRDSGIDAVEQPCVPLLAVENPTFKLSITQNGVTFNSYGQRVSMNVAIRRAVRICSTGARFP